MQQTNSYSMNRTQATEPDMPQEKSDELKAPYFSHGPKVTGSIVGWECPSLEQPSVTVESVDGFDARGMKRVYGRCEVFGGGQPEFELDMWRGKDGRLLARFSSRGLEIDSQSYAVHWGDQVELPYMDEKWMPEVLRKEYDNWLMANIRFPLLCRKIERDRLNLRVSPRRTRNSHT
jgi:hypothetical protein